MAVCLLLVCSSCSASFAFTLQLLVYDTSKMKMVTNHTVTQLPQTALPLLDDYETIPWTDSNNIIHTCYKFAYQTIFVECEGGELYHRRDRISEFIRQTISEENCDEVCSILRKRSKGFPKRTTYKPELVRVSIGVGFSIRKMCLLEKGRLDVSERCRLGGYSKL